MITPMNETLDLHSMTQLQMRQLVQQLMGTVQEQSRLAEQQSRLVAQQASDLQHKQALLDKLTYEMALLKRLKFAAKTEALNTHQRSLLEDALEEDLQAVDEEIAQMRPAVVPTARLQPKRQPLPAQLPRQEFKHEPAVTQCCGQPMRRIGEDVAETLDYTPGQFTVERHVRGKWVCTQCQTLVQAPVPAHVIDKGIPTAGLLAQVLVAKYIAQWVGCVGVALMPLVQVMQAYETGNCQNV
jgi:hypothetical protein